MVAAARPTLLMAAAAAALGAGAYVLAPAPAVPDAAVGTPMLPGLTAAGAGVTRIAIEKPSGTVTLERMDGTWTVADLDGWPADPDDVRALFVGLAGLRRHEPRTATPDLWPRLEVEDPIDTDIPEARARSTAITLSDAGGATVAALIVGKAGPQLGPEKPSVYVRSPGEDRAWLAAGALSPARNAAEWSQAEIVNLRSERVRRAVFERDGATLELLRPALGRRAMTMTDVPDGRETVSDSRMNSITFGMEFLDLTDSRRDDGTIADGAPIWTTTFESYEGLQVTARAFADPDDPDAAPWIAVDARHDAPAEPLPAADAPGADRLSTVEEAAEQAATIAARTAGRLFRIPAHKRDRLATERDDLLAAPAADGGS